jgi:hypothetical protein
MSFVLLSEQSVIISLSYINYSIFLMKVRCVPFEAEVGILNIIGKKFVF